MTRLGLLVPLEARYQPPFEVSQHVTCVGVREREITDNHSLSCANEIGVSDDVNKITRI